MIYYVIAGDILAEKAGTLKCVISIKITPKKPISLVWFRELAWTAQEEV